MRRLQSRPCGRRRGRAGSPPSREGRVLLPAILIPVLFAYDLDLIQEDLDAGHEVHVVRPSRTLRFADTAPFDVSPRRFRRELRRLRIPRFASHGELDDFRFHGHDAGNAVLSSPISSTRDSLVDLTRHHDFPGLLCIRIHPNGASEKPSLQEQLEVRVKQDFVRLIGADSPVDTDALIDASEKVITFGSTVSMEAAYWGKPTISFATVVFDQLDSVYHPKDRDEAVRLVVKPREPQQTEDALKYGYYCSVFDRPLRYAKPVGLMTCYFRGEPLHGRGDARSSWRRTRLRNLWLSHLARRSPKAAIRA